MHWDPPAGVESHFEPIFANFRTFSHFLHIFAIAVVLLTFCKIRKFPYDFSQF